jgi:hypothetical protein
MSGRTGRTGVLAVGSASASVQLLHELAAAGLVCVTCFEPDLLLRLTADGSWVSLVIMDDRFAVPGPAALIARLRAQAGCPVLLLRSGDRPDTAGACGADAVLSDHRPLRRQLEPWLGGVLEVAGLRLDRHTGLASWRGSPLRLTHQQFRLLWRLGEADGGVVSLADLSEVVYDGHVGNDRQRVMAHVRRIRRLIESDPRQPQFIQAVRGIGFRLAG